MLVKQTLQSQILTLLTSMRSQTEINDTEFAENLSAIIDTYIKSATITIPAGIAVSTTGSPTAQTGTTTVTATATIK